MKWFEVGGDPDHAAVLTDVVRHRFQDWARDETPVTRIDARDFRDPDAKELRSRGFHTSIPRSIAEPPHFADICYDVISALDRNGSAGRPAAIGFVLQAQVCGIGQFDEGPSGTDWVGV